MMVETIRLPDSADAYAELRDLLIAVAGGTMPGREAAGRYMTCRQAVIAEIPRGSLPGFLTQCGSISKFIEFITLYHWDPTMRRALVADAFGPAPRHPNVRSANIRSANIRSAGRTIDIFDDAF